MSTSSIPQVAESCGFRLVDKAEILLEQNLILEVGAE